MAKITIEIDDTLEERVESAIDSVKTELIEYLEANPDQDELPCLNNDLDYSGAIHEIIDGSVPIYTKELEDNWYLHSYELEKALDDAGLYSASDLGKLDNDQRMSSAFYCYIYDKVNEWYQNEAQEVFDTWRQEHTFTYKIEKGNIEVFDHNGEFTVGGAMSQWNDDIDEYKDYMIRHAKVLPEGAILIEQD